MLYIQDFSFSQSYSTHEAIIHSCSSSIRGYGAYAFASTNGIEILFNDKEFNALLERGTYSLIVGIDKITNVECLERLAEIKNKKPNLDVRAFYHDDHNTLFHPKFSFFREESGEGSLIVGSSNLTIGGLRKNREAFSMMKLSGEELTRIEAYWDLWVDESRNNLKDIEDEKVIDRARENIYSGKKTEFNTGEQKPQEHEASIIEGWSYTDSSNVLLAEIPKSGDRWKQANFDLETFTTFFGADPTDNSQRILLRNLKENTSLSSIEIRPSVSVKSQNYRFELDAASGLLYPDNGRPIGIFIQLTTRMFLYHLFMPSHSLYGEISNLMETRWTGRSDRMKRIVIKAIELDKILRKSVFQQYKT